MLIADVFSKPNRSPKQFLYWIINSSASIITQTCLQSVVLISSLVFQNSVHVHIQIVHFRESACLVAVFHLTSERSKVKRQKLVLNFTSRPFQPKAYQSNEKLTSYTPTLATAYLRDLHCTFRNSNQVDSSEPVLHPPHFNCIHSIFFPLEITLCIRLPKKHHTIHKV